MPGQPHEAPRPAQRKRCPLPHATCHIAGSSKLLVAPQPPKHLIHDCHGLHTFPNLLNVSIGVDQDHAATVLARG